MPTEATFPAVIDSTMRSSFNLCPHHFFRRYCQGLKHESVNAHLHFGGCLAKGLEVTRRAWVGGEPQHLAVLKGVEAVIKQWAYFEPPTNPSRTEAVKTLDSCILALSDYFREWPLDNDPIRIASFAGEPCIEFRAALPIPGCFHPDTGEAILYAGRFDTCNTYGSSYWGLDDKTTGSVPYSWADQWKLRGQLTGYAWLAHAYDMPVIGMLVRGICPTVNGTRLVPTVEVPQPPWKIQRWLSQLQADVWRMLACWNDFQHGKPRMLYGEINDHNAFPQILDSGCYSYNRPCEFMSLCDSQHPERWEDEYQIQRWEPLVL